MAGPYYDGAERCIYCGEIGPSHPAGDCLVTCEYDHVPHPPDVCRSGHSDGEADA